MRLAFLVFAATGCAAPGVDLDDVPCGHATPGFVLPRESMDSGWTLCSNQPCNSDDSEVYLGFVLGVLERNFDYSFWVRLEDGCGGASNRIGEEFSL